jgi:hypothetical protein
LAALEAGCFSDTSVGAARIVGKSENETGGVVHKSWDLDIPEVPEGAFAVLGRMASVTHFSELLDLSIEDEAPSNVGRVAGDRLAAIGPIDTPFPVDNHLKAADEQKELPVLATFQHDVTATTFQRVRELFQSWARILQLGGFEPAPWNPWSMGVLSEVSGHLSEEVIATIEGFAAGPDALNCLILGLLRIHRLSPIQSLEIG